MRKQSRYKNKYGLKPMPPMLVIRGINPQMETKERAAIVALSAGFGTHEHYHTLMDVYNLLAIASQAPGRDHLKPLVKSYKPALDSIQLRFEKFGKFGMDYNDKKIMTDMINTSADFWLKQPAEFYVVCDAEVRKYYQQVEVAQ